MQYFFSIMELKKKLGENNSFLKFPFINMIHF